MITTKPRRLLLRLLAVASLVSGTIAQDHLEPERGSLNEMEPTLAHAQYIQTTLLKDAAFHYRARIICLPSFKPAWSVTLVAAEEKDQPRFFIDYAGFEERRDGAAGPDKVKRERVVLDRDIAESVQAVWLRMLRQVRFSDQPISGGADGVTYHFSRFVPRLSPDRQAPPGWESGQIWTPDPSSRTGQLVALATELRDYAIAPAEGREKLKDRVRTRTRRLQRELAEGK